jgi:hypothetical protein
MLPPERIASKEKYLKTEAGKVSHAKSTSAYRSLKSKQYKANTILGNAVRNGIVIPWPCCAVPECSTKPHAHHPDYDRPLDVVWLCPKHHKETHTYYLL